MEVLPSICLAKKIFCFSKGQRFNQNEIKVFSHSKILAINK
jgi:hypothetical protein